MSDLAQYIVLHQQNYFKIAQEFVDLHQLFKQETLLEKLNFYIDMIVYPLYIVFSTVLFQQTVGLFTILSIHKAISKWQQYLRYLELRSETDEWKCLIQSIGGPFISTNDETYHMYVYADGMQRSYNHLFTSLKM
jgi:hypothetical protein